jgi:hypothetical protein
MMATSMLVTLNVALKKALELYLGRQGYKFGSTLQIVFRLPDKNGKFAINTISVFLYDVHEDLQLRSSEVPSYDPVTRQMRYGQVSMNFCYLVTFWDQLSGEAVKKSGSQTAMMTDAILAALVSMRTIPGIEPSFTKVLPPSEHLGSLGTFWQSLDNRPRLCLNYSVSVPIDLMPDTAPVRLIESPPKADMVPIWDQAWNSEIARGLWITLLNKLANPSNPVLDIEAASAALSHVRIVSSEPTFENNEYHVKVHMVGSAPADSLQLIGEEVKKWNNKSVSLFDGGTIYVDALENELMGGA